MVLPRLFLTGRNARNSMKIESRYAPEVVRAIPKRAWLRFLMASPQWLLTSLMPLLASKLFEVYMNERVIDYPFVLSNLQVPIGVKILDLGCLGSILPIEMASLGYRVWGLDLGDYPLEHPNLTFVRGDVTHMPFEPCFFDVVTAVSTLEHIGLERYGDHGDSRGDRKAVEEITRVLKPGGRLLLTVPFGRRGVAKWKGVNLHRAYDWTAVRDLVQGLDIVHSRFYMRRGDVWMAATKEEAESADALQVWNGFHVRVAADCHVIVAKPESGK